MRREWPLTDHRQLRPDASNIAPFLYQLKNLHATHYQRIGETIQLIAPFFEDFLLEPEKKGTMKSCGFNGNRKAAVFLFSRGSFPTAPSDSSVWRRRFSNRRHLPQS